VSDAANSEDELTEDVEDRIPDDVVTEQSGDRHSYHHTDLRTCVQIHIRTPDSASRRTLEIEGVVICLERGANDSHTVQLMSLPPNHLLRH